MKKEIQFSVNRRLMDSSVETVATCLECDFQRGQIEGEDADYAAIRHARDTGHSVDVRTQRRSHVRYSAKRHLDGMQLGDA